MPYKHHEDRLANLRWKRSMKQLERFRSMGLEPVDLNNNRSDLLCTHCGKQSPRNGAHMFRHHPECPMGIQPKYWSRRPKTETA